MDDPLEPAVGLGASTTEVHEDEFRLFGFLSQIAL